MIRGFEDSNINAVKGLKTKVSIAILSKPTLISTIRKNILPNNIISFDNIFNLILKFLFRIIIIDAIRNKNDTMMKRLLSAKGTAPNRYESVEKTKANLIKVSSFAVIMFFHLLKLM